MWGTRKRSPAEGRGRRVSCGKGGGTREEPARVLHGRGPVFHGKSAPEQGPTPGGLGGQTVVDSAAWGKDIYVYPLRPDFREAMGVEPRKGYSPLGVADGLEGDEWAQNEFGGA